MRLLGCRRLVLLVTSDADRASWHLRAAQTTHSPMFQRLRTRDWNTYLLPWTHSAISHHSLVYTLAKCNHQAVGDTQASSSEASTITTVPEVQPVTNCGFPQRTPYKNVFPSRHAAFLKTSYETRYPIALSNFTTPNLHIKYLAITQYQRQRHVVFQEASRGVRRPLNKRRRTEPATRRRR